MALMYPDDDIVFSKPSLQSNHGLSSCFKGCSIKGSLSSEPTSVLDLASNISPASSPGTSPIYLNCPSIATPSLHKSIIHKSYNHIRNNTGNSHRTLQSILHSHEVDHSAASSPLSLNIDAIGLSSASLDSCDAMANGGAETESLQEVLEGLHVDLDFEVDAKSTLDDIFVNSPSSFSNDQNVWDENDIALLGPVDEFLHVQGLAQCNVLTSPNYSSVYDPFEGASTYQSPVRPPVYSLVNCHDESHGYNPHYRQSCTQEEEELQSPCDSHFTSDMQLIEYTSRFSDALSDCNNECNFPSFECNDIACIEHSSGQDIPSTLISREHQDQEEHGLHLVHFLLSCARIIGQQHERRRVQPLLRRLRKMSSPHGGPLQRIAFYVSEALFKKVSNANISCKRVFDTPNGPMVRPPQFSLPDDTSTSLEQMELDAFCLALYQVLPYTKFLHFTANQAILEAVADSPSIHVIDLDIQQGIQWPSLLQSLAIRPQGSPRMVRMSAIGPCISRLNKTGKMLAEFAETLNLNFTFHPIVAANMKEVDVNMIGPTRNLGHARGGSGRHKPSRNNACNNEEEAIALNLSATLHSSMWEGVTTRVFLRLVKRLDPRVLTIIKAERQNKKSSFMDKFIEALFYYSAFFDSMEASMGRRSEDRERIERVFVSYGLESLVCNKEEGEEEIMNTSTEEWQAVMRREGFQSIEFSDHALYQAKLLLNLYASQAFRVGCSQITSALSINWKQIPLFAVLAFSPHNS